MWPLKRKSKIDAHHSPIATVYICAGVLENTREVLVASGGPSEKHEGVAYWAGKRAGDNSIVTTCIAPEASTTDGSFQTSSRTNAQIIMCLAQEGLELLAQVHSHPGSWVDHSRGDDKMALMPYEGFFSIVVPNYGYDGMWPLTQCGIHRFTSNRFRRLSKDEVEKAFRVTPGVLDLRTHHD